MAIRDEAQHAITVEVIDKLMQVDNPSQAQSDYAETLVQLVEAYESKRHAIDLSKLKGDRMLRHILDQSAMSASDLARLLGVHASMGSKILIGQRRLTWDHAKILGAHFKVAPALFMD
jgi:antitoxin component HigA of HigAB toxin-antitoxin module